METLDIEFISYLFVNLPQVVHPILDREFFLDAYHKLRLKEEFGKHYVAAFISWGN